MSSPIIERIELISQEVPVSTRQFEISIGKTSGYINMSKKGKGNVGIDVILNIVKNYPQYSLEWLLLGTGDKFKLSKEKVSKIDFSLEPDIELRFKKMEKIMLERFSDLEEGLSALLLKSAEIDMDSINIAISKISRLQK